MGEELNVLAGCKQSRSSWLVLGLLAVASVGLLINQSCTTAAQDSISSSQEDTVTEISKPTPATESGSPAQNTGRSE